MEYELAKGTWDCLSDAFKAVDAALPPGAAKVSCTENAILACTGDARLAARTRVSCTEAICYEIALLRATIDSLPRRMKNEGAD